MGPNLIHRCPYPYMHVCIMRKLLTCGTPPLTPHFNPITTALHIRPPPSLPEEFVLINRVNQLRQQRGLRVLQPWKFLEDAARVHSMDMATKRFVSHIGNVHYTFGKLCWQQGEGGYVWFGMSYNNKLCRVCGKVGSTVQATEAQGCAQHMVPQLADG